MTMPTAQSIDLDNVHFAYDAEAEAAMNFSVHIPGGRLVALMGPSGSGKSTLFSLICGFETPHSGSIRIGGTDITSLAPAKRPVSMVFQDHNLFAHMTVADNISLGLSPSLKLTPAQKDTREAALEATGLSGLGGRLPSELSGGQRQRVALARVLVRDRPVLLLDEAFASLGPALRSEMLDLVRALHDRKQLTTIMITHFPEDARRIADDILFVDGGRTHPLLDTASALDEGNANAPLRAYLEQERTNAP